MKKTLKIFLPLLVLVFSLVVLVSCGKEKTFTVTYKDAEGNVIGTETVKPGQDPSGLVNGYWCYKLYTDQDCTVALEDSINSNITLYGYWETRSVDSNKYTYYSSFSLSPDTFNPLQYKSTTDSIPLDYTTNSLYEFAYKTKQDGTLDYSAFDIVPVMAAHDPVDMTLQYALMKEQDGTPVYPHLWQKGWKAYFEAESANYQWAKKAIASVTDDDHVEVSKEEYDAYKIFADAITASNLYSTIGYDDYLAYYTEQYVPVLFKNVCDPFTYFSVYKAAFDASPKAGTERTDEEFAAACEAGMAAVKAAAHTDYDTQITAAAPGNAKKYLVNSEIGWVFAEDLEDVIDALEAGTAIYEYNFQANGVGKGWAEVKKETYDALVAAATTAGVAASLAKYVFVDSEVREGEVAAKVEEIVKASKAYTDKYKEVYDATIAAQYGVEGEEGGVVYVQAVKDLIAQYKEYAAYGLFDSEAEAIEEADADAFAAADAAAKSAAHTAAWAVADVAGATTQAEAAVTTEAGTKKYYVFQNLAIWTDYTEYYIYDELYTPIETGYVFRILLNEDAKWQNGDAITAADYLYSMETLLNGNFYNYRASNYYNGSTSIYGAKDYFYSGKKGTDVATVAYKTYSAEIESKLKFSFDLSHKEYNAVFKYIDSLEYWGYLTDGCSIGGTKVEKNDAITFINLLFGQALPGTTAEWLAMDGKTIAELKADPSTKAKLDAFAAFWNTAKVVEDDETLTWCTAEYSKPTYTFDHVGLKAVKVTDKSNEAGIKAGVSQDIIYDGTARNGRSCVTTGQNGVDANAIDIIYTGELQGFYIKYNIGLTLVHKATYENCIKYDAEKETYSCSYGTSVKTYMGYGPYVLKRYIVDSVMEFEKNPNWFGFSTKYADSYGAKFVPEAFAEKYENAALADKSKYEFSQYMTTNIILSYVPNISTREMMFLNGLIDVFGMNKSYYEKYASSDQLYKADGAATYYGIILSDYEALVEREAVLNKTTYSASYTGSDKQYNKTILAISEFRQALCYAIDRAKLCANLYPGGKPATSLFSNFIIADPNNGVAFNSFDTTKEAIVEFWGLTDKVGSPKASGGNYTLDEVYNMIIGYDLEQARTLVETAVSKAKTNGWMGDNTIVSLEYCASSDSETEQLWYNTFKESFVKLFEGTSLAGKFEYTYNTNLGSDFGGSIQAGKADTAWGFGWSGGELDPYDLFQVYVDAAAGAEEPYQYDMWIDRDTKVYEVTLSLDVDGKGAKSYTYTVYDWYQILNGVDNNEEGLPNWKYGKVADSVRATVLAALELKVLQDYTTIPLFNQGSLSLLSYKINYGRETYNFAMGFGGLRYMTYNYNDAEWSEVVKQAGGTLEYK